MLDSQVVLKINIIQVRDDRVKYRDKLHLKNSKGNTINTHDEIHQVSTMKYREKPDLKNSKGNHDEIHPLYWVKYANGCGYVC